MSTNKLILSKLNTFPNEIQIFGFSFIFCCIITLTLMSSMPEGMVLWTMEYWTLVLNNFVENSKDEPLIILSLLWLTFLIYNSFSHKRERVFLTPSGINYQSSWPKFLQWINPDWSIEWSQIQNAYFVKSNKFQIVKNIPFNVKMILETGSTRKKVFPCIWFDLNKPEEMLRTVYSTTKFQYEHIVQNCPIIKYANEMGIEVKNLEQTYHKQDVPFADLTKTNPHNIIALILCIVCITYALTDSVLNKEVYASIPPIKIYVITWIAAFLLVIIWFTFAKVYEVDKIIMSFIVAFSIVYASIYGVLRINQLTDTQGLQNYKYVLQKDLSFKPLNNNILPNLRFAKDLKPYLSTFKVGSIHEFELRKGVLGFYQLDEAPVYANMKSLMDTID